MSFPGHIFDGISRLFEGDIDETLVFVLIFLFIFLSGRPEERLPGDRKWFDGGIPIILIVVFLILFLSSDREQDLLA